MQVLSGNSNRKGKLTDGEQQKHPFRTIARFVLRLVLGIVIILALVLVTLQIPPVARWSARTVLALVNPWEGTNATIGDVEGTWLTSLTLRNVRISNTDETFLISIDTLSARYDLTGILRGALRFGNVTLRRPFVRTGQNREGALTLTAPFASKEPSPGPSKPLLILADNLSLSDGEFVLFTASAGNDRRLNVREIALAARSIRISGGVAATVDTFHAQYLTGSGPAEYANLQVSGSISETELAVRRIALTSARTSLQGRGTISLPISITDSVPVADLSFSARPLAYADIHPFVPSLGPEGEAEIELSVHGDGKESETTARIRLPHGGAADIQARTRNPRKGSLMAAIQGTTRALSIAGLTGKSDPSERLNCTFDAKLEGPTLDELQGEATLTSSDSYLGSFGPMNTRLHATITNGNIEAAIRGTVLRAAVFVRGSIRPFEPSPPFELSATASLRGGSVDLIASGQLAEDLEYSVKRLSFRNIDLAPFLGNEWTSALSGNLTARGRGTGLRHLTSEASLQITPSRLGSLEIRGSDIHATAAEGTAEVEGSAALRGGAIRFLLHLDPYRASPSADLRRFDFSQLDLRTLLGSSGLSSDLSGQLRAEVRFASAQELERFASGLPAGTPGGVTGSATLTLGDSRLNRQSLSGALHAALRDRELSLRSALSTPDGGISINGTGRPFDQNPAIDLPEISFQHIDIGRVADLAAFTTDLTGRASLRLQAGGQHNPLVVLSGDLGRSSVNHEPLEEGRIRGTIQEGRFDVVSDLVFGSGRATVSARGTITDGEIAGRAEGTARLRNLSHLLSLDSVRTSSIDAEFTANGTWGRNTSLQGSIRGRGHLDSLRVDSLEFRYAVTGATVSVDTLLLLSNAGTIGARGTIAALDSSASSPSAFMLDARVTSLKPFERIAGTETGAFDGAELRLSILGRPGQTKAAATLRNHVTEIGGIVLNSTDISAEGTFDRNLQMTAAQAEARLASFSADQFGFEESVIHLSSDGGRHTFHGSFDLEDGGRILLAGMAHAESTSTIVALDTLTVSNSGPAWVLDHPAEVTVGRALRVKGFSLRSGARKIIVEGILDPDGEQDFTLIADSLNLSHAAKVLGRSSLEGSLTANARITGPSRNASARGDLSADIRSSGQPLGTVRLKFGWVDSLLTLDGTVLQPNGNRLVASANIPATLAIGSTESMPGEDPTAPDSRPLDFSLRTDGFDLATIQPFFDPKTVSGLSGKLIADIRGSGRLNALQSTGRIILDSSRVSLPVLGVTYGSIKAEALLDGRTLRVQKASLESGTGSLSCTGTFDFSDFDTVRQDLSLNAQDFLAVQTPTVKGTVSGTLSVRGTISAPEITGRVQVKDSYFNVPDATGEAKVESVQLTEEDYAMLENWFNYRRRPVSRARSSTGMSLHLDLDVAIERNTWIRKRLNPTLAIELEGNLSVHSHPDKQLSLIGNLRPLTGRSYVGQFGRQFEITEGEIAFNGSIEEMELRIGSEYKVPSKGGSGLSEVVIRMNVASRLGRYTFSLTSDPAMDEADILSYLATGKSTKGALANTGDQGSLGSSVALEQLVGAAGGLTEGKIPLDVFQIRQEGARGITIVAGNYVNPRTYLGIRQPILINQGTQDAYYDVGTQAEVEYEASPWLYLNFQGGSSRLLLFLKSRYAY